MREEPLRFERYGRFWAVYENESLLCVTVYLKGARALVDRLTQGVPLPPPTHLVERANQRPRR